MDTDDGFIAHVKTDDIYKDIAEDVEKKLTQTLTSILYEIYQPLPKGKNGITCWIQSKNIGLLKRKQLWK